MVVLGIVGRSCHSTFVALGIVRESDGSRSLAELHSLKSVHVGVQCESGTGRGSPYFGSIVLAMYYSRSNFCSLSSCSYFPYIHENQTHLNQSDGASTCLSNRAAQHQVGIAE